MSEKSLKKYQEVKTNIAKGMTVENAVKAAKTSTNSYYAWKKKAGGKRKYTKNKLQVFDVPVQTGKAFIIFGTPTELAEFARVYS